MPFRCDATILDHTTPVETMAAHNDRIRYDTFHKIHQIRGIT